MLSPYIKRQFNATDIMLALVNLLPVWGVWYQGWNPKEIFIVYCLESVMVGLFNIFRMWLTTLVKKKDRWSNNGSESSVSGYVFILFFIAHYGFFVFIQVSIFLSVASFKNITGVGELLLHFPKYLSGYALYLLLGFAATYFFQMLKDFIINGVYKTASLGLLMFQPYMRIFIQQFVVIAGSFFLLFGAGKMFIIVFAVVKIFFEVAVNYDKALENGLKQDKADRAYNSS